MHIHFEEILSYGVFKLLEEKLGLFEKEMELKLEQIKILHKHRGNRGDNVEEIVRGFIKQYIPSVQRVGKGEITDSYGNLSNETDVVILNEHHPYLNDLTEPSLFFIEGVAAAGEVKSNLSSTDVETTLKKCRNFKSLIPYFSKGSHTVCNVSDKERFVKRRPFFLFAFKSQLTLETIFSKIIKFNEDNKLDITQQIDGIFLLDRGYIINFGDGNGAFALSTPEGKLVPGFIPYPKVKEGKTLFNFLTWLSVVQPRIDIYDSILIPYLMQGKEKKIID